MMINQLEINLQTLIFPHLSSELLKSPYREQWSPKNPTLGFCSVVSEVAYFLLGGSKSGWMAYATQDPPLGSHWWLEHPLRGRLDLTKEQYTNQSLWPPYERGLLGRPCAFMGMRVDRGNFYGFDRKPSKRATLVLEKIKLANQLADIKKFRQDLRDSSVLRIIPKLGPKIKF